MTFTVLTGHRPGSAAAQWKSKLKYQHSGADKGNYLDIDFMLTEAEKCRNGRNPYHLTNG